MNLSTFFLINLAALMLGITAVIYLKKHRPEYVKPAQFFFYGFLAAMALHLVVTGI
jgi:hypothetical protein